MTEIDKLSNEALRYLMTNMKQGESPDSAFDRLTNKGAFELEAVMQLEDSKIAPTPPQQENKPTSSLAKRESNSPKTTPSLLTELTSLSMDSIREAQKAAGLNEEELKKENAEGERPLEEFFPRITARLDFKLTIDDEESSFDKFDAMVLYRHPQNAYYKDNYDPTQRSAPDCVSYDIVNGSIKESYIKTNDGNERSVFGSCTTCWYNKFKSGKDGKGKACQNRSELYVLLPSDCFDDADDVRVYRMSIPPTSLSRIETVFSEIKNLAIPYWGICFEFSMVPPKSGYETYNEIAIRPIQVLEAPLIQSTTIWRNNLRVKIKSLYDFQTIK